jgi:hypothetical protein
MDWCACRYGTWVGICEYKSMFDCILACASAGWNGMAWCEIHGIMCFGVIRHTLHGMAWSMCNSAFTDRPYNCRDRII